MSVLLTFLPKQSFLRPNQVIESLGISKGDTIIDFGCGSGYWAIPLAGKVGREGKLYAVDETDSALEIVKSKADLKHLANMEYKKASYGLGEIPVKVKANLIMISNILSLVPWPVGKALIESTNKNAEIGTKLVVIDWKKGSFFGPKKHARMPEEEVMSAAQNAGFEFKMLLPTGSYHFGMLFEYTGKK